MSSNRVRLQINKRKDGNDDDVVYHPDFHLPIARVITVGNDYRPRVSTTVTNYQTVALRHVALASVGCSTHTRAPYRLHPQPCWDL